MKLIKILVIIFMFIFSNVQSNEILNFNDWKKKFKALALNDGITEETFNIVMSDVKFLPKVIEYDRYQPEFYEDTKTYISKRSSNNKLKKGLVFYKDNFELINKVEEVYDIEKELLLSLMGIETNFGTYVGKMDIVSSLSTLSFDKRRSEFFTKELLTLLKLVDSNKINYKTLYGSWAGAFGYFQFMPSTIKNHAIDFNKDDYIDLKNSNDAFASAANYLRNMGWKSNSHCFYKIELDENIKRKYLNVSAKKLTNKKKLKYFKKFIKNYDNLEFIDENIKVAIITPDKDIIPSAETLKPAYIVFDNYEIILKWNRSLRFALAVCTLKNKIRDEI